MIFLCLPEGLRFQVLPKKVLVMKVDLFNNTVMFKIHYFYFQLLSHPLSQRMREQISEELSEFSPSRLLVRLQLSDAWRAKKVLSID